MYVLAHQPGPSSPQPGPAAASLPTPLRYLVGCVSTYLGTRPITKFSLHPSGVLDRHERGTTLIEEVPRERKKGRGNGGKAKPAREQEQGKKVRAPRVLSRYWRASSRAGGAGRAGIYPRTQPIESTVASGLLVPRNWGEGGREGTYLPILTTNPQSPEKKKKLPPVPSVHALT